MGGFTGSKFFQNIATATVNSCKDFYVAADSPFETSIGETRLELKDADLFANRAETCAVNQPFKTVRRGDLHLVVNTLEDQVCADTL